jgi:hypothetical protein
LFLTQTKKQHIYWFLKYKTNKLISLQLNHP